MDFLSTIQVLFQICNMKTHTFPRVLTAVTGSHTLSSVGMLTASPTLIHSESSGKTICRVIWHFKKGSNPQNLH